MRGWGPTPATPPERPPLPDEEEEPLEPPLELELEEELELPPPRPPPPPPPLRLKCCDAASKDVGIARAWMDVKRVRRKKMICGVFILAVVVSVSLVMWCRGAVAPYKCVILGDVWRFSRCATSEGRTALVYKVKQTESVARQCNKSPSSEDGAVKVTV